MQWRGKERQRCAPRNEATKESQKMMSGSVRDGVSLSLSASHQRALGFPGSAGVKEPTCRRQWETRVWSRGQEDPLEEGMATHSSILAWRIPQTEKPGGLQSMGLQRVRHDWSDLARSMHTKNFRLWGAFLVDCGAVSITRTFTLGTEEILKRTYPNAVFLISVTIFLLLPLLLPFFSLFHFFNVIIFNWSIVAVWYYTLQM